MKKPTSLTNAHMARFILVVSDSASDPSRDLYGDSDPDPLQTSCSVGTFLEQTVRNAIAAPHDDPTEARLQLSLRDVRIAIAEFVVTVQKMHGGAVSAFLEFAELDRNTHRKLISAVDDAKGDRTMLETIKPLLSKTGSTLVLTLNSCVPGQAALIFSYSGEDSKAFCSNFLRQCRAVTGLSKKQLDAKLGKEGSGYSSKVETGRNKKGVSIATLIEVAVVCGFDPSIGSVLPKGLKLKGGIE